MKILSSVWRPPYIERSSPRLDSENQIIHSFHSLLAIFSWRIRWRLDSSRINCLAGEGLNENLHATTETKDKMDVARKKGRRAGRKGEGYYEPLPTTILMLLWMGELHSRMEGMLRERGQYAYGLRHGVESPGRKESWCPWQNRYHTEGTVLFNAGGKIRWIHRSSTVEA